MKATHKGECQLCGRTQLLPGGGLSKHGYTTRWGFFSGTCRGYGHLPFELSCDMIDDALANVRDQIQSLSEEIESLQQDATSPVTTMRYTRKEVGSGTLGYGEARNCRNATVRIADADYKDSKNWGAMHNITKGSWCLEWRGAGDGAAECDLQRDDGSYLYPLHHKALFPFGTYDAVPGARLNTATLTDDERTEVALEIATKENQDHAKYSLTPRMAKLEEYVSWLIDRKRTWEPRELQAR